MPFRASLLPLLLVLALASAFPSGSSAQVVAPSDFTVTAIPATLDNRGGVLLSWTYLSDREPASGVTGWEYRYRSRTLTGVYASWPAAADGWRSDEGTGGGCTVSESQIVPRDRSHRVQCLAAGMVYQFQLRATTSSVSGPSVTSAEVAVHLSKEPEAPTGLTAVAGDGWVQLSWDYPAIVGVELRWGWRSRVAGGEWRGLSACEISSFHDANTRQLTIAEGIVNGTAYEFQIAAYEFFPRQEGDPDADPPRPPVPARCGRGGLPSSTSNAVTPSLTGGQIPGVPRNVVLVSEGAQHRLSWDVPPNADAFGRDGVDLTYEAQHRASDASFWGHITVSGLSGTFDVVAGKAYRARVRSVAGDVRSDWVVAGPVTATTAGSFGAPTNVEVFLATGDRAAVTWDPPATGADLVESYEVQWRDGRNRQSRRACPPQSVDRNTCVLATEAAADTLYEFRVRGVAGVQKGRGALPRLLSATRCCRRWR